MDEVDAAMASLMGNTGKKTKSHHHKKKRHKLKRLGRPKRKLEPESRFQFPTERDVATFAQELGMDLEFDSEQQWLVDQALASELPPLWTRVFSPSGRSYYVREPTKQEPEEIVTWVHPLVPAYSKIFDNILQEQMEAQKAALGIVSDEENEDEEDEGESDIFVPSTPGGPKLSSTQRKKLRASLEDALLYYKKLLGDPASEDVRPKEDLPGYWDCEPEDVEDMATFFGIEYQGRRKKRECKLMWVARMACTAPLPPGWKCHEIGDDVTTLCAETKGVSVDELGEMYSCMSWMCKTDTIVARMALEMHPSHQYFETLLKSARDELGEEMEGDEVEGEEVEEEEFDEFDAFDEVIQCEFRNEMGGVYVYNFVTEESSSTGRNVRTPEEVDVEEEKKEKEEKEKEEKEKNRKEGKRGEEDKLPATSGDGTSGEITRSEHHSPSSAVPLPAFDPLELRRVFDTLEHVVSSSSDKDSATLIENKRINSNQFHHAFVLLGMNEKNFHVAIETSFVEQMQKSDSDGGTVDFDEFVYALEKIMSQRSLVAADDVARPSSTTTTPSGVSPFEMSIISEDGALLAVATEQPTPESTLLDNVVGTRFGPATAACSITREQVLDFATHIGLDVYDRSQVRFHHLIEECLVKEAFMYEEWIYRADPNGNAHYYRNVTGKRGPDLTKGEGAASGWDQDESMVGHAAGMIGGGGGRTAASQSQLPRRAEKKRKEEEPIQSEWSHPRAAKYKKKYVAEKKAYEENVRIQRVRGLRKVSASIHQAKMDRARDAGGQHIVRHGVHGESLELAAPNQNVTIARPEAADIHQLLLSPNKRLVPLQPGFSDVKKRQMIKEQHQRQQQQHQRQQQHGSAGNQLEEDKVNHHQQRDIHSPIQNLLREGQLLNERANMMREQEQQAVHRAFRSCTLIDTAEEKRENEEKRRMKRRKTRTDHTKKKREAMRRTLDERARLAKEKQSNPSFPPLQLDATAQLSVISLSPSLRTTNGSSSGSKGRGAIRISSTSSSFLKDAVEVTNVMTAETLDVPTKKGMLSPSHQGRFAAVGNLVPVSTERWVRAHDENESNDWIQQEGVSREQSTIDQYKFQQFQKMYDATFEEENNIMDDWLLNRRHEDDDDNERVPVQEEENNKDGMSMSFSVGSVSYGVAKNITLAPISVDVKSVGLEHKQAR